jgi:hypothetical protein
LEFVASASVKWRTAANFQVSQRHLGNNDGAIIITGASKLNLQTKKVQTNRLDTDSRKATGHV